MTLHEAVDAHATPQHLVDTSRDDLTAVELSPESASSLDESRDDMIDVLGLLPPDGPLAVWRQREGATKLLGVLLDLGEQGFDLVVGGP
jgi:hypothetical protein